MNTSSIAIIGAGVRGTAALGRLSAHLKFRAMSQPGDGPLEVHLIDPFPPGSGKIWREAQPTSLVMNTVPAQSTVFDDPSLGFNAPSHGPHFAKWCEMVAAGEISDEPDWVSDAAASTHPWSSPSRALYGHYLRWAYREFAQSLPSHVRLVEHAGRAVALTRVGDRFTVLVDQPDSAEPGPPIAADAVLLALGWLKRDFNSDPEHDITPENPIDQAIDRIVPGERVAVRGIGMGFTDLVSLVTEERGGRYVPEPSGGRPGALRYEPSGREPTLFAGSRRGIPFLAKPDFGAVPPRPRLDFLTAATPGLIAQRPLDFEKQVLPLIERDAAAEYHRASVEIDPSIYADDPAPLLSALDASVWGASPDALPDWRAIEARLVPDTAQRFDPTRIVEPVVGPGEEAGFGAALVERIAADAAAAALGSRSPWKRGLHVYQAARAAIIPLTDFGGSTPASRAVLRGYLAVAGLVGSGPPLFRVEQLLSAHHAGVIRFIGPRFTIHETPTGRVATTIAAAIGARASNTAAVNTEAHDPEQRAQFPVDRVVDAHLDLPDPTRIADPLISDLLSSGLARLWHDGSGAGTPTIEITREDSALVDSAGSPVPGLHSVGPLHEELRRYTIIAPIPGVGSTVLREIDAAVSGLLAAVSRQSTPHSQPSNRTDWSTPTHD